MRVVVHICWKLKEAVAAAVSVSGSDVGGGGLGGTGCSDWQCLCGGASRGQRLWWWSMYLYLAMMAEVW